MWWRFVVTDLRTKLWYRLFILTNRFKCLYSVLGYRYISEHQHKLASKYKPVSKSGLQHPMQSSYLRRGDRANEYYSKPKQCTLQCRYVGSIAHRRFFSSVWVSVRHWSTGKYTVDYIGTVDFQCLKYFVTGNSLSDPHVHHVSNKFTNCFDRFL